MATYSSFLNIIEGLKLITKPNIRQFVIIPVLINILLFSLLFFTSAHFFHIFNLWLTAHLPHWLVWLSWLLWILFFGSFFIFFVYTFTTLSNLLAAPFNNLLAEKVELYLTGTTVPSQSFIKSLQEVPKAILRQLTILWYYLPRALLLLLLFIIPIAQHVAGVLWFFFNAWFLALQYLDYPADNHQVSVKNLRQLLRTKRWISLGFGFGVLIFSIIPLLNFIAMPAAIAGAVKTWVDQFDQTHPEKK